MPHAPAMTEASPGNESVMKCDEEGKKKKKRQEGSTKNVQ